MIVELTREQITILSFSLRLYMAKVHEQNTIIPTDIEKSEKDMADMRSAFNTAIERG